MSFVRLLEDGERNFGSEQINTTTTTTVEDHLVRDSSTEYRHYNEAEMEMMIMRILDGTLERSVIPVVVDVVRRLVKGQIELAIERRSTSMNRNLENEMLTSEPRSLKLQFVNKISPVILTGKKIVGEELSPFEIALVDSLTGEVVNCGPESSAKVEIVVLEGDSNGVNGDDWTPEEFDSKIVREMQRRKSLLVGNVHLNLKEGIGLVEISFTHNSSWMKSCQLRLGAKVVGHFNGIRVDGAKTEPFTLKDYRCTYREKRSSLSLDDKVWRLKKIAKDGPFHNRLKAANINIVKDFLIRLSIDPQGLEQILNGGDKMWKVTVEHARKCIIDKTVYVYPSPSSEQNPSVVFNVVGQMLGLLLESQYVPMDKLSQTQKADAHMLVVSAFEHWEDVVSFVDECDLTHDSSHLFNSLSPSNSTMLEASSGNHFTTCNMVDHDVASTSSPSIISFDMDEFWSTVDPQSLTIAKSQKKWKVVSGVWSSIKLLTRKRIVPMEEIHVSKKSKCC